MEKIRFLECLSKQYPTIDSAATEIINLQSILNLPKGTEHFLSDIHGEYKAFAHVLRNGSGAVMKKIDDVFGDTLFEDQKEDLASLIYYPSEKLQYVKNQGRADSSWYRTTLYRLVSVCQIVSSKYTRSKVRKAMPENFRYVIEELITEKKEVLNKKAYYDEIINTIIEIGCADEFIVEMSNLIQRLVIDHLHIIGDIYDRGYGSHFVMDSLMNYHSLDIQWGNHDVLWMGAFAGQPACIANIVRTSLLYDNLSVLENGYGISMMPLVLFAMETYADDPCAQFTIRSRHGSEMDTQTVLAMKMHKAITIIQFKLEGQLIAKHPEYNMDNRRLLDKIDADKGTVTIDGKELTLYKGDLLMLNQYVEHAIHRAEFEDIGINFIALPEFFEIPLGMLQEKNVLAEFIAGAFRQKSPVPHYLIFRLKENPQIENLMENMIESMLYEYMNEDVINQYSMGLVFLYLLNHLENLSHNSSMDYKETIVQSVLEYINSDCKNANLTKIAADTHQSVTVLSKLIKQKTGANFQDLLQQRRSQAAVKLLEETDLSIEDISLDVGYENQSYFFRQFKKRFGMTPRSYRITHQK